MQNKKRIKYWLKNLHKAEILNHKESPITFSYKNYQKILLNKNMSYHLNRISFYWFINKKETLVCWNIEDSPQYIITSLANSYDSITNTLKIINNHPHFKKELIENGYFYSPKEEEKRETIKKTFFNLFYSYQPLIKEL